MKVLKRFWWVLVILVIALGGFLYYRNNQAQQQSAGFAFARTVKLTRGSISTNVSASGLVRSNQDNSINWAVDGKVGQVLVKVGDSVKTGQLLASLDPTSLPQSVLNARQNLVNAKQALDDLENSKVNQTQAAQDLFTAQTNLENARQTRQQLNFPRASADTLVSAQANLLSAQTTVDQMQKIYDQNSNRDLNDPIRVTALSNLLNAEAARDKAKASVNWYQGKPSTQDFSKADADLAVAQAKYDDALRAFNRLKNGPSQEDITAAQSKVTAAQQQIDSVNLVAPFDGIVTDLKIKPGDLVSQGDEGLRIDDMSKVFVDLDVSEVDVNNTQVGQDATITFDAIPNKTYNGKVTQVGQVNSGSSSLVSYTVSVQITDADAQIKTGMTGFAAVTTTTLGDILLAPSRSIRVVSGQSYVYVPQNGKVMAVPVDTGATSDTETQILSGNVKEGDAILANPSTATINSATRTTGSNGGS
jgi:HlyD family secretion protein